MKFSESTTRQTGFTLVEIVVVLALAALILAGILLAVGAATQSARDAQRRNVIPEVESALEQWALTHSGGYTDGQSPAHMITVENLYGNCGSGMPQYLDCGVTAPGGARYVHGPVTGPTALGQVSITDRNSSTGTGTCGSSGGGTNPCSNGYCVTVMLEGGNNEIYGSNDINKTGRNMTGSNYCQ